MNNRSLRSSAGGGMRKIKSPKSHRIRRFKAGRIRNYIVVRGELRFVTDV